MSALPSSADKASESSVRALEVGKIRCSASGFQIDDATIFAIHHDDVLVTSGLIGIVWESHSEIVLGGEEADLRIVVTKTNDDPAVVGVMEKPQRRLHWTGFIDLSADELDALRNARSANGQSSTSEQSRKEHQQQNETENMIP